MIKSQKGAIDLAVAIVAMLVIIVLAIIGFVSWSNRSKTANVVNVEEEELPVFEPDIEYYSVVSNITQFLTQQTGLTATGGEPSSIFWRVPIADRPITDYITILVPGASARQFNVDVSAGFTKGALKQVSGGVEGIFNLSPLAVKTLEHNQFIQDTLNQYTDNDDSDTGVKTDYKGYVRGNIKCLVSVPTDDDIEEPSALKVSISCINNDLFEKSYSEQFPILRDLFVQDNPKGFWMGAYMHDKIARKGDFLRIRALGGYHVLKFEDGKYKWLFGGQDDQSCETVDEFKVPKEIYGNCFLETESGQGDDRYRFTDDQLKSHYLDYPED